MRRAAIVTIEVGSVGLLLAATLGLTLATATSVRGQGVPPAPAAPRAPASPSAPAVPEGAAVQRLALALLEISAERRSIDALVLEVGDDLLAVSGGRARIGDLRRLAALLVETFHGRDLTPGTRRSLAGALVAALPASDTPDLDAALDQVRAALRAAGVQGAGAVLIESELRRLAAGSR